MSLALQIRSLTGALAPCRSRKNGVDGDDAGGGGDGDGGGDDGDDAGGRNAGAVDAPAS